MKRLLGKFQGISYGKSMDYLASRGLFKKLSPLVGLIENHLLTASTSELQAACYPIFIVGAPRTGSTILYQALTDRFDVTYIDNTACRWCNNLLFGIWLSSLIHRGKAHGNFSAEYGTTSQYGGGAPSECGEFWYRWLSREDHYVGEKELATLNITEISSQIGRIVQRFQKPMVFKNLNMGQRLKLIKSVSPDARLVFVRRTPHSTVRSILKARSHLGVANGDWWSVRPKNYKSLMELDEVEMCVAQVFYLEEQIFQDIALFDESQVCNLHYDEFSEELLEETGRFLGLRPRESYRKVIPFMPEQPIPETEVDLLIKATISKYPFREHGAYG